MLRMHYKQRGENGAQYALAGLYRGVYGVFALLLIMGLISTLREGEWSFTSFVPILLLLIALFGLGYREKWVFDSESKTITYTIGCYFITKRNSISVENIQRVEITHFVRGRALYDNNPKPKGRNRAMLLFSLRMDDNSKKDIEIIEERKSGGKTELAAHRVASLLDLPLYIDREPYS